MGGRFSIRNKLLGIAIVGVALTLAVGAAGLYGLSQLGGTVDLTQRIGKAQRFHQDADMQHDHLRAGVFQAILIGNGVLPRTGIDANQDVRDGAARFRADLVGIKEMRLPPDLARAVAGIQPDQEAYIAEAERLAALAGTDPRQAVAGASSFEADFVRLEGTQDRVTDELAAASARADAASMRTRSRARAEIIVAALVALLTLLGFCFLLGHSIVVGLNALSAATRARSEGDPDARAPVGHDEIGALGTAFNDMADTFMRLVSQVRGASTEVSSAAAELSASAKQLAATTTEQSASVTEVSATTEELARASASIAETVDHAADQASETRSNLEQAEADIEASSERTLALAERVGQIQGILTLINEIADQTSLLALNAAIEAARAGEAGRGFAVVAEEVRRLAERSKGSAADIAVIVNGVRTETNATVMAMEKGAKQMQQSLVLVRGVTEGTAQVRLTTQQQRLGTGQVVEAMEQLSEASRQTSGTAQQIAANAGTLSSLAHELEATADDLAGERHR